MAIEFPTLAALLNQSRKRRRLYVTHTECPRSRTGNRVVPRDRPRPLPGAGLFFRDYQDCVQHAGHQARSCLHEPGRVSLQAIGSLAATEMKRSGIEVRADWHAVRMKPGSMQVIRHGHACMNRAGCPAGYRQSGRDRDEAKRNRGSGRLTDRALRHGAYRIGNDTMMPQNEAYSGKE